MSIVAGRLKTRLKTPVLTVWETLAILCPPRPPVPLDNIPRNYPTCSLPWGSLSQLPSRYFHRPTEMDAKLRASRERPHGSAGGESIRRHRMRFSVRVRTQNASFRRVRFFSPAQTWHRLTEKRILQPASHGKAHSGPMAHGKPQSGSVTLTEKRILRSPDRTDCAFPSRCGAREVWGNHPPGCGALWRMAQLGKCARATPRQAAGRVARMSADLGSESGLTEKRTLPDRWGSECAFPSRRDRRMRLSVRVHAQNALFRRMRLSSPAQTWRRLTEKRILQPWCYQKAHFATPPSRCDHAGCAFP